MVLNLLTVFWGILLLVNFKKFFIVFMAFAVWISCFFSPTASVFPAVSMVAFVLFLINYKKMTQNVMVTKFPMMLSFVLLFISLTCSNFLTGNPHYYDYVTRICVQLLNIFMLWCLFENNPKYSIHIFIKSSIVFAILLCGYGFFEAFTRSNPFVSLMDSIGAYNDPFLITEIRFGVKRTQSLLLMHTSLAGICISLFAMLVVCSDKIMQNSKMKALIIALVIMTFFTGSRSGILAIVIAMAMLIRQFTPQKILGVILVFILLAVFQSYFDTIFQSLSDKNSVGGSSYDMREVQFEIALSGLINHYWLGNGLGYTFSDAFYEPELFGAESLWIPIAVDQGVLGCFATLAFFIQSLVYCIKQGKFNYCFYVLAMFVFFTMTSVPQYNFTNTFIYLYIMIRVNDVFANKKINSIKI